jgi:hypothetical protein
LRERCMTKESRIHLRESCITTSNQAQLPPAKEPTT